MDILKNLIDNGQDRYTTEIKTDSAEEVCELLSLGFSYQLADIGVVLRAPEDWIVDITDFSRANSLSNDFKNVMAFYLTLMDCFEKYGSDNFIKNILSNNMAYENFTYKISQSTRIWGEIRIIGSDSRVKQVRCDVYNYLKSTNEFLSYYEYVEKNIECKIFEENIIPLKKIKHYDQYKNLFLYYETVHGIKHEMLSVVKTDLSILPDSDFYLFSPKSCFEYMFNIIDDKINESASFLEVHAYNVSLSMIKCYEKNMKGKRVAIFDKVYSGKTIDILTKHVIDNEGIPIRIGVYPKNITNYKFLDYLIFLDKMIPANSYSSFFDVIETVMSKKSVEVYL